IVMVSSVIHALRFPLRQIQNGAMVNPFNITVASDHEKMSRRAASAIVATVQRDPDTLLCPASGASTARCYDLLADYAHSDPRLFARTRVLQLDEWVGLPEDSVSSCRTFIRDHLLQPLRIDEPRSVELRPDAPEPLAECVRINAWVEANGPI